ncbi:MAG TPA: sterol desaturase family protein [Candidatus Binatia bacterium]|jgi:4-alpha-methyl-delta7-sterol-4alpha-methyl oxidase|nr:sterol desaturase family protein [Candidatus Binatia bacterium]
MLDTVLGWYREPLFWLFPVTTAAISAAAFMLFAVPLTMIAARDPAWARPYRIQSRIPREQFLVWPSVKSWAVNNLSMLVGVVLFWPVLRLAGVHAGPLPPWWVMALQVLFFFYLDDLLYYWSHRALHTRWLYKRIHGWHHRIVTPWAITGNYMHPLELSVTATVALIGPLLLGAHVVTVWIWFVWRQWEAAEGHSGYDFPWTPSHFLPGNDGARHHDWHHAKVKGNYAGFTPIPDRLFSTFARGYTEDLAARR